MRILGMISGTSHDGIDGAVVDFSLTPEGQLQAQVQAHGLVPYSAQLRSALVAALPPAEVTLAEVTRLDTLIGQAFAEAAEQFLENAEDVGLIVSHGQTVYHWVEGAGDQARVLGTLQLGQPAWIAERTGRPVLSDVRIRDITAGGQGAPLASTLDALLLAGRPGPAGALNLGGISNVSVTSGTGLRAWDIGPANALIDAVVTAQGLSAEGFDRNGRIAASGTVDQNLLEHLLSEPYYALPAPKSTGKELFHLEYVQDVLHKAGAEPSPADLVATLTELTVRTIADALTPEGLDELFVSGGGVHNPVMMAGLRRLLPGTAVGTTEQLGVGADEKEAVLMALIGWLSLQGLPASLPTATGAGQARVLGTFTPGAGPLRLPEPGTEAPASLVFRRDRLRSATLADRDAIVEVFLACWTTSYAQTLPEHLVARMNREKARELWESSLQDAAQNPAAQALVAVAEEQVVGVVKFGPTDTGQGHIRSLYVSPRAQCGGYGRLLLEAATASLIEQGLTEASLWVFEDNRPSRRFYQKHGWAPDGARCTDPAYGEPQIRLVRTLPGPGTGGCRDD